MALCWKWSDLLLEWACCGDIVRRVYWPEERVGGEGGAADVTRNSLHREGRGAPLIKNTW